MSLSIIAKEVKKDRFSAMSALGYGRSWRWPSYFFRALVWGLVQWGAEWDWHQHLHIHHVDLIGCSPSSWMILHGLALLHWFQALYWTTLLSNNSIWQDIFNSRTSFLQISFFPLFEISSCSYHRQCSGTYWARAWGKVLRVSPLHPTKHKCILREDVPWNISKHHVMIMSSREGDGDRDMSCTSDCYYLQLTATDGWSIAAPTCFDAILQSEWLRKGCAA